LLNLFSSADVPVEDRLFATLDPTVRLVEISPAHRVLLSDTVGFIRKLPHHLVASFRGTLDEVAEADILLHVVDIAHPLFDEQIAVVNETLEDIGARDKATILVFNKVDRIKERGIVPAILSRYPNAVCISAARGINIGGLTGKLTELLDADIVEQTLTFRQTDYPVISRLHDLGEILEKTYDGEIITIRFRMNRIHADRLRRALSRRSRS
jgi:GTP-binding protein HflX